MKAELTGRLIEYSTCKQVAAELGSRARDLYTAVRQPQKPEGPAEYSRKQDPDRLVQAWFSLMGRSQRRKKPPRSGLNRWSPRRSYRWQAVWPTCCAVC